MLSHAHRHLTGVCHLINGENVVVVFGLDKVRDFLCRLRPREESFFRHRNFEWVSVRRIDGHRNFEWVSVRRTCACVSAGVFSSIKKGYREVGGALEANGEGVQGRQVWLRGAGWMN